MLPQQEKRSSPYALSGSFLDAALVKMPPPERPPKPKRLFYILPNGSSVLDHDSPLPRKTWWECNLSQFFNVVADRARKPAASLSCLTFTYNWAPQQPFLARRLRVNRYWEAIRERVKGAFLKARNSTPTNYLECASPAQ
jgi:hypothetical protein